MRVGSYTSEQEDRDRELQQILDAIKLENEQTPRKSFMIFCTGRQKSKTISEAQLITTLCRHGEAERKVAITRFCGTQSAQSSVTEEAGC